mmetsp:Transcript_23735/g.27065  ORF Transcript_23735/g.27065 Transcript_23735/m.27065 type:complete len:83 (-) Transcript_23735:3-251(-)
MHAIMHSYDVKHNNANQENGYETAVELLNVSNKLNVEPTSTFYTLARCSALDKKYHTYLQRFAYHYYHDESQKDHDDGHLES